MFKTFVLTAALAMATAGAALADTTATERLTDPVWKNQPDEHFLRAFYPDRAFRMERSGYAVVSCTVSADGRLGNCKVFGQQPDDQGFGSALMKISEQMQMQPTSASGAPTAGRTIELGARFTASSAADPDRPVVELVTVQR
jgi:TonB family protein